MTTTTKKTDAFWQLERRISKARPVAQAALRQAIREAFDAQRPRDRLACLEGAIHSLQIAQMQIRGADPEAALMGLSTAVARLAHLELAIARAVDTEAIRGVEA